MRSDIRDCLDVTLNTLGLRAAEHDLFAFSPHDRQERALVEFNREVERKLLALAAELEADAKAAGVL